MAVGLNVKTKPLEQVRESVPLQAAAGGVVRFNFFLPCAQLDALKVEALGLRVSVADIIREALELRTRLQADMGASGYALVRTGPQEKPGAPDAPPSSG